MKIEQVSSDNIVEPQDFIFGQCPAVDAKIVHGTGGVIAGWMSCQDHLVGRKTAGVVLMRIGKIAHTKRSFLRFKRLILNWKYLIA